MTNRVVANVYGRGPSAEALPLRVLGDGTLADEPQVTAVLPWTSFVGLVAATPLLAFTPFRDDSRAATVGFRNESSSAGVAVFSVDESEDGVRPAKSYHVEYALAPGEHDVLVLAPLHARFIRVSVAPQTPGNVLNVALTVLKTPR